MLGRRDRGTSVFEYEYFSQSQSDEIKCHPHQFNVNSLDRELQCSAEVCYKFDVYDCVMQAAMRIIKITEYNRITNLWFDFTINGWAPLSWMSGSRLGWNVQ